MKHEKISKSPENNFKIVYNVKNYNIKKLGKP